MTKQIECQRCNISITYETTAPKFCSECGASLTGSFSGSQASFQDDVTVARTNDMASTLEDATMPPDQTGPVTKQHVEKFNLQTVGPYRLVRKLGQGGMGTVYEAQHTESGRSVALKLLSPEVRGTEEMVKRFQRESQIAASINHPRSTFVYESGDHDGQLYITMELMGGGTLKDIVAKEGPLPLNKAVDYVLDIIDGLLVAHNAGIVHRDLKPSNSFVDHDGRIKVGDFGLAKSFLGDSSLTQTGTFMGTPQYAAPEQIRNADVDERTDIYALGGTLFYLLTGRAPFVGNPAQVISSIASDVPPKINKVMKGIPRAIEKLIAQTLEKNPERRPFNLNVVRDALLPFSTRGALAADAGRRMAAFFADTSIMLVFGLTLISFMSPIVIFALGALKFNLNPQYIGAMLYVPFGILYFGLSEWLFGRTIGKWIFGMRVINSRAQSPGLAAVVIRVLLIPGLMLTTSQLASIYFIGDMENFLVFWFKSQLSEKLLVWASLLGLVTTARKSNGYRCVHDLLSGTRVVRLAGDLDSRLMDHFAIAVPLQEFQSEPIGEYQLLGSFGRRDNEEEVFLGRDLKLDREIWLFTGCDDSGIDNQRRHLTRACRLRIINQSNEDEKVWYATESVPGIPFIEVVREFSCDWKSTCPLFRDLAYELALADEEGTIPADLTIDHIWLDHAGGIRLLDHAVVSSGNILKSSESDTRRQSVKVMIELFHRYMQLQDHPMAITQLVGQLETKQNDDDVFDWLVGELNDSIDQQTTWNWIDRAGMYAVTFGVDFSFLFFSFFLVSFLFSGLPLSTQMIFSSLSALLIVGSYGYFLHGGPAMRLSNVRACQRETKLPVSQSASALRSVIAWSPMVMLLTMFFAMMFGMMKEETLFGFDFTLNDGWVWVSMAIGMVLVFIFGSMFFGVWNPQRGLPEFLTGTRLMRK